MAQTGLTEAVSGTGPSVRTFLIGDVRGYTRFTVERGDEAGARLAQTFASIGEEIISQRGGDLIEVRGDEILAAFSSARQALKCAVDLQARLKAESEQDPSLPLKVGIGLDAGEAIPVGGGYRGAALNLAARLCSLAGPGEVLSSDTVTNLARKLEGLEYRERGTVQLKGFSELVKVLEVVSSDGSLENSGSLEEASADLPIGGFLGALPANRIVARERELAAVVSAIDSVVSGNGRLVLLAGEPGVGKTRVAQEATLALRNREFLIAAGRCYEAQQSVPFYPFAEALTALYQQSPPPLRESLQTRWPDLAGLLPALTFAQATSAGPQDQQRALWAVTGFVQAVTLERPVAILLDDLHWADAASLELLQHLARHTTGDRLFLLGTYRDVEVGRRHPLEAALRDLRREGLMERLDIRRLDGHETSALMAMTMGEEEISEEFTDLVYSRTEGNPFFVQQVMLALVERGDVFRRGDRWDRRAVSEIEVPESIRSVVGQRLERLSVETQELLAEASVLGQTFEFDELVKISERAEREVESGLEEASRAGMVRDLGKDLYGFDHALTQQSLYGELSSRRRRRLHLAAAEAIESDQEQRVEAREAELAWHFLEADEPARASVWSFRAGEQAQRLFANSDAEYHFRTATQLAAELRDRQLELVALERLGRILYLLARYEEAIEVLEKGLALARDLDDLEFEMSVAAAIGWVFFEQSKRAEGTARLVPVLQRWEESRHASRGAVALHASMGNLYWGSGDVRHALELAEQAVDLATRLGDPQLVAQAEGRHGLFHLQLGELDEALTSLSRAIDLSEAAGDLDTLARAVNNRGIVWLQRGEVDRALADQEKHVEIARRVGSPNLQAMALGWAAQVAETQGKWDLAGRWYGELESMQKGVAGGRGGVFLMFALNYRLKRGDNSALSDMEGLLEDADTRGEVSLWATAEMLLSDVDRLAGNLERAEERVARALNHPDVEAQLRPDLTDRLIRCWSLRGDFEHAKNELERVLHDRRSREDPTYVGQALATRSLLRAEQGRWEEAEADRDEAMKLSSRAGMPWPLACFLMEWGEVCARMGRTGDAKQALLQALSMFSEMGANLYASHVGDALDRLPASI